MNALSSIFKKETLLSDASKDWMPRYSTRDHWPLLMCITDLFHYNYLAYFNPKWNMYFPIFLKYFFAFLLCNFSVLTLQYFLLCPRKVVLDLEHTQRKKYKFCWWMTASQKMPKSYFLSQLSMTKINKNFKINFLIWEYQFIFRRPFFVSTLFSTFNL